ncbi:MAG: peptidoglycan-binding protein [Blastocatellia bacterium]
MRRGFVWLITLALLAALVVPDALAKRSRGGRKSAASSKRAARGKSSRGREARGRSSRGHEARGKASRGRDSRRNERASRGGKLSRRERRALARSERRTLARSERGGRLMRERVVVRGRHGRRVVRYRYVRRRSEPEAAPVAATPRPTGSGIPGERVAEIQNALIKAGYLEGPASGQYDDATVQAMKEFQTANGFAATGTPSAPALKKLGVAKRSNDGYAMPVNSVSENERKQRQPQSPE